MTPVSPEAMTPVSSEATEGLQAPQSTLLQISIYLFIPGASNFTEAMKMGSETYHHLKSVIKAKYGQDGELELMIVSTPQSILTSFRNGEG